jgi:hypothetical protein
MLFCPLFIIAGDRVELSLENDFLEHSHYGYENEGTTDGYLTNQLGLRYFHNDDYELEVYQSIYTPENKDFPRPQPGDRSYAGWLAGNFTQFRLGTDYVDSFGVGVGVIGPASLAGDTQINFHKWIDCALPQGWDTQLNNEPTLQISANRTYSKFITKWLEYRPGAGANLGNALIDAELDNTIRCGYNIPRAFPQISNSKICPVSPKREIKPTPFACYVFVSLKGKAIARDIFLDGNTFNKNDNITVDKENFVADNIIGVALTIYRFDLSITHIERTREFETQIRDERFEGFQIGCKI